mgnify:CR=1 FL=1
MYIGTQGRFPEDHDLEMLAQLGVNNIDTTSGSFSLIAASMVAPSIPGMRMSERTTAKGLSL